MRFQVEEGVDSLTVGGQRYEVEDGFITCENHEHHSQLKQLGCVREDEIIVVERVVAEHPPEVPEGYLTPEAATALVEENEDLIQGNKKLHEELHSAREVESQLRDRIQELEARTTELTGLLEEATNALQSATETASGAAGADAGAESTTDTSTATETASPASGKKAK